MSSNTSLKIPVAAAVLAMMTATSSSAAPDSGAVFLPFKAIYALTFLPDGQIPMKSGSGRMTIELTGSKCTGYKLIRTMANTLQFPQGKLSVTSESVITENPAGTQMAFSYVERHNGNTQRQEAVTARRGDNGIVATSSKITGGQTQLPANVVFPIRNEIMLIDAIASGRKALSANVYNPEISPSSIDKFSASIGAEVTSALPKGHVAAVDALANKPRHRIKLTFTDSKSGKVRAREQLTRFAVPVFTVSDTAVDHLKIDTKIVSLTMLPQKSCP